MLKITRRSHGVLAGFTGVAIVCLTAIALAACSAAQPVKPERGSATKAMALEPSVDWSQPLRNAHRATLAKVGEGLGFAIPMPKVGSVIRVSGAAPDRIRLTAGPVWVSGPETALTFNRGTVTVLVGRATYKSPGRAFRTELAAIKVGRAAIGRVNSRPALIVQPRTDYTKSNPALVEFELHGLDINVISTRFGTNLLTAIAESIQG
jgi:hypothetical protein